MKQITLVTTLFFVIFSSLYCQIHTPVFPNLEGEELADSVVLTFKPSTVLNYAMARDTMYGKIDNKEGKVTCIYTGHSIDLPKNTDPSIFLFMNNSSDGINAEHVFPRSKGASEDSGNAFSDLHHLFPTRSAVNSARSNFPFQEILDSETTNWYYQTQNTGNLPTANLDLYSERINGAFEPAEMQKGNIARSMFYFYLMYQASADAADPDFFESQRETLCDWHLIDPVDENEWNRTHKIAQYQDGKPNPYILDCSLALRSFCTHLTTNCIEVSSNSNYESLIESLVVFPNPAYEHVNIRIYANAPANTKVNVYSSIGNLIQSATFQNNGIGENTFTLPITTKGMVVLEIVSGHQIWREKVLLVD